MVGMITNLQTFRGPPPPKNWKGKNRNIWHDFTQLLILTANTSGNDQDVKNWKQTSSRMIPAGFGKNIW